MSIEYNANISKASKKLAVMREISLIKRIWLWLKGRRDGRLGVVTQDDNGYCNSQFAMQRHRKLDADLEELSKQLHVDTFEGMRRLAAIERECANIEEKSEEIKEMRDLVASEAREANHAGDEGVPEGIVAKRREVRAAKAARPFADELASYAKKIEALLVEKSEIEQVHRQREQIAADSRNLLCRLFEMEMHVYLDAAGQTETLPPDTEQEHCSPMHAATI